MLQTQRFLKRLSIAGIASIALASPLTLSAQFAACNGFPVTEGAGITPTVEAQTVSGNFSWSAAVAHPFEVCGAGGQYTFSFCGMGGTASYDTWLCVATESGQIVAQVDDSCGLLSELEVTLEPGRYAVLVSAYWEIPCDYWGDPGCGWVADGPWGDPVAMVDTYRLAYLSAVDPCGQVTPPGTLLRGDCNADGEVDISDPICTLGFLFDAGETTPGCIAALNANGDDSVDISDPVYALGFLFSGGPPPVQPFPSCGVATLAADTELGCETASTCAS